MTTAAQTAVNSTDVKAPGGFDNTVLLVSAYAQTERYLPAVLGSLDGFWPNHPEAFVATDGAYAGDNVLRHAGSFTEVLSAAVKDIRCQRPQTEYVFLMLEDLVPLSAVNLRELQAIMDLVRGHDLRYVVYNWDTGYIDWAAKKYNFPANGTLCQDGTELREIGHEYPNHTSVLPSVWRIDHLEWIVARKLEAGILDPWKFEDLVAGNTAPHYMVYSGWPTVFDGFRSKGRLNPFAVSRRRFPASPIMTQLRKEYCGSDNFIRVRTKYVMQRIAASGAAFGRRLMQTVSPRARAL